MNEIINSGVYKIENTINRKVYIGSSSKLRERFRDHVNLLKIRKHENSHLQAAWNKYGSESFTFEIFEYCEKEFLAEREQYYIDLYNSVCSGYNICPVAYSHLGRRNSDESKKKMSLAKIGKPGTPWSPEKREKMSKIDRGYVASKETREKMSNLKKGIPRSEETKLKLSLAKKGISFSEEHKKNLRLSKLKKKKENQNTI